MGIETTTKQGASEHSEDVRIDSEIETLGSSSETTTQKSLLRKLDCTLLPLFSTSYLLAYMVCVVILNA